MGFAPQNNFGGNICGLDSLHKSTVNRLACNVQMYFKIYSEIYKARQRENRSVEFKR